MNQRQFATQITQRLQNAGHQALFAGGCVRDDLLGIEPNDFDVATSATPDEVRELFGRKRTLAVGAAFGVITVLGPKPAGQVEVATFRRDEGYSDGRRPDHIEFTDAREDALRRDFTINGMFFDPVNHQVLDYVGGQADLEQKQIRAIGDPEARINEDKLRMLRALRFAARFAYSLESQTLEAIRNHHQEILLVSGERIAAEFNKMLQHPNRVLAIELLSSSGLLRPLLPELDKHQNHYELDENTQRLLQSEATLAFPEALARWLYFEADRESIVSRVSQDWKLSNEQRDLTLFLLRQESTIRNAHQLAWSNVQPTVIHPWFSPTCRLAECVANTIGETQEGVERCVEKSQLPSKSLNPAPLITGSDLIAFGLSPGRQFKGILQDVRNQQLDGIITTRDAAIEFVQQKTR